MRLLLLRGAAVLVLLLLIAAGLWFLGAVVAWSTASAVVLVGGWFGVLGIGVLLVGARRAALRWTLRGAFVAASAALLAGGAYTSLHETTVNERLESGVPASQVAPKAVDDLLAPQR